MKRQLLQDALEKYGATISVLKKGHKQERYRIEQISRSFLGKKYVHRITSVDIADYRDQRLGHINPRTASPISASSVRLEMSLLSHFFDIARIEWGLCENNPVKNVRKPKVPPGRERRLTPREDRMILRYAHQHSNPTLYSIIVLALETAMRQGEILELRWENIDLKKRVAHLPDTKNGSRRDVPLTFRARDALIRLGQKNTGKVFQYTAEGIKSTWRFMLEKLGIADLHFHDLRHEAISRLFELGTLDVMEIAAISGHKNLSMLKRYTHLSAQKLAKKLEAGKGRNTSRVMDMLVPYPAVIKQENGIYHVHLPALDNMETRNACLQSAIREAQDILLRRILLSIRMNVPFPQPERHLDNIDDSGVVMIDPLATEDGVLNPA